MRWAMRVEVRSLCLPLPADSPRDEERMTDSMDIYCKRCGEPWEIDSLHDVADSSPMRRSRIGPRSPRPNTDRFSRPAR